MNYIHILRKYHNEITFDTIIHTINECEHTGK